MVFQAGGSGVLAAQKVSADPGRRKGERVREEEVLLLLRLLLRRLLLLLLFFRLLRPSLPCCFPVRGLWFCAVFPRPSKVFWSGTSSSEILILEAGSWHGRSSSSISRRQHQHHHHQKQSVLFLGFRRDVREFLGGILGLQGHGVSPSGRAVWLCLCAVAAAAANFLQVFCSVVSRVSDVTLESFWVGFSDSFVLQGHGVLLFRNRPLGLRCGAVLRAWELAAAVNIGWIGSDSISSRIAG